MKTFAPLDDALLHQVFQPLSDHLARWGRIPRPYAVGLAVDLASAAWVIARARALGDALAAGRGGDAIWQVVLLGMVLAVLTILRGAVQRADAAAQARRAMMPYRAIAVLLMLARLNSPVPTSFAEAADLLMLAFAVTGLYLCACAEPPQPSRPNWTGSRQR